MNDESGDVERPRRLALPLAAAGVVALHVLLVLYFVPPRLVFSPEPLSWFDFEFHAVEISRVTEALDRWGKSWAWDPQLFAGYPEGTVFDSDSKAWELFVFTMWKAGLPQGLAFNLFVLLVHLALPPVVYLSARLLGLRRWTALVATLMASLLWHFDTTLHLTWRLGTVSYAMVGYGGLLPLAALHAYLRSGRGRHLALLCASLSLAHLVHPFVFNGLVLPMGVMYAGALRNLSWRRNVGVAGAVLCTLAVNSWWLAVLLGFWGDVVPVVTTWQETFVRIRIDLLGLEWPGTLGAWWGERRGLAILFMGAAITCLVRWRLARDERFLPFAVGIGAMLAAAYLGEFVPGLEQTQSYRHIIPAMMLTVLPASCLAVEVAREWMRRRPSGLALHVVILAGLLLAVLAAREIHSFFPGSKDAPPSPVRGIPALGGMQGCSFTIPRHLRFRHTPLPRDFHVVTNKVRKLDDGKGRFLVESWDLAEHLAWRTRAQVMGGFPYRNVKHTLANVFPRMEGGRLEVEDFERYLTDYAIRWVIFNRSHPEFDALLVPSGIIGEVPGGSACTHALYKTKVEVNFLAENHGEVDASLNRIDVRGTDPGSDAVLRFHFLETFECRPDCSIERDPVPGDPVGFIRVKAPHPADFAIINAY